MTPSRRGVKWPAMLWSCPDKDVTPGIDAGSGRALSESPGQRKHISVGAGRAMGRNRFLAEGSGVESRDVVIFHGKADLDWFAAYLAVFDVGLAADGQVQHHRNFFSTIWTGEFVFHGRTRYCNRSGRTIEAPFDA